MDFSNYIDEQENYFKNGNTLPISKRKKLLKNLKKERTIATKRLRSLQHRKTVRRSERPQDFIKDAQSFKR